MASLLTPIQSLTGIGPVLAKKFSQLGLTTLQDALFYFPFRHEDWRHQTSIANAEIGADVTLAVTIDTILARRSWRRRGLAMTEALVGDDSDEVLSVVWFNQPYLAKSLQSGDRIYLSGTITQKGERRQMQNPSFERATADPAHRKLVPVYRGVEGLSQRQIRNVVKQAVDLAAFVPETLPPAVLTEYNLLPIDQALRAIHFPPSPEDAHQAVRRLKFDELLDWQRQLLTNHQSIASAKAIACHFQEMQIRSFVQSLPFELTTDQRIAAWQILQNLDQERPMTRLLQGDVGSGKTVVAVMAAYNVVLQHHQVAFFAPTVLLAEQHFQTLSALFTGREVTIAALAGGTTLLNTKQATLPRPQVMNALREGSVDILIGTHAMLEEDVQFKDLALLIIDEQQRFGVQQRHALLASRLPEGVMPHLLSLSATPIPRTLALALAGELEITTLRKKPAGVAIHKTEVIGPADRERIHQAIQDTTDAGQQVFVVTPLIEESDALGVRAATVEFERLKELFSRLRVGLVHGSMPAEDRVAILDHFRQHELDILVGTTVIELGLDIHNATLMVVEGAERFGLAQLHQLRGRIGRGTVNGLCLLATDRQDEIILDRLAKVAATDDGFALAELDLQIRGRGEFYGLRQSGLPDWQLASLSDTDLLRVAHEVAAAYPIPTSASRMSPTAVQPRPILHRE